MYTGLGCLGFEPIICFHLTHFFFFSFLGLLNQKMAPAEKFVLHNCGPANGQFDCCLIFKGIWPVLRFVLLAGLLAVNCNCDSETYLVIRSTGNLLFLRNSPLPIVVISANTFFQMNSYALIWALDIILFSNILNVFNYGLLYLIVFFFVWCYVWVV